MRVEAKGRGCERALIAALWRLRRAGEAAPAPGRLRAEARLTAHAFRSALAALRADGRVVVEGRTSDRVVRLADRPGRPPGPREALPPGAPALAPRPKAGIDVPPTARADRPAVRRCLRCREAFRSAGFGNRLCPQCRKYASQADDWLGEAVRADDLRAAIVGGGRR